jgi:hypothetical protein
MIQSPEVIDKSEKTKTTICFETMGESMTNPSIFSIMIKLLNKQNILGTRVTIAMNLGSRMKRLHARVFFTDDKNNGSTTHSMVY